MRRLAKGLSAFITGRRASGAGYDVRPFPTRPAFRRRPREWCAFFGPDDRAGGLQGGGSGFGPALLTARRLVPLVPLLGCLSLLVCATAAQAGKVPGFGKLGSPGTGAGQLGGIARGVATNFTGAGGASAGDVYVTDTTNDRVVQFKADGQFVRAFGVDVVAPGAAGSSSEIQRVAVNAAAGTFRLTFGSTGTNATGAAGTGDIAEGSTVVENVSTSAGAFLAGEAIGGAGIPAGSTIASVGAGELTLSQPASETSTGVALTADLAYDSPSPLVESALNALTTVNAGGGSVTVSGGPGGPAPSDPYVVTFDGGPLNGSDVAQISGASGFDPLSGGSGAGANEAKVATTNAGGTGYEICNSGSTCKAGASSSAAGGINAGQGIAVDPDNGDVFVVSDRGRRINVYSATGRFEGAFGWQVDAALPEERLQFCTFATGCIAGSRGDGAGQFGALTAGISSSTPAVDPTTGHLFVPDLGNRRISEFRLNRNPSAEVVGVEFVRAFGGDVAPTVSEIQTVTISGATGGTFALGLGSELTGATGVGDIETGSNEITNLTTTSGTFVRGEEIFGPGLATGTRITAVTPDAVTMSSAATASTPAAAVSAALPYNADASTVQGALQALGEIGPDNVKVTGPPGGPYTVEFTGGLAGQGVDELTGDGSALTGASATLAIGTVQDGTGGNGAGFEECTEATGCKAGTEGSGKDGVFFRNTPNALAFDSTGDMYIATDISFFLSCQASCALFKFKPGGGPPEEFAADQLSIADGSTPSAGVAVKSVTVDPSTDHVLVAKMISGTQMKVFEFTRTGAFVESYPPGESGINVSNNPSLGNGPSAFAAGAAGRLYVAQTNAGNVSILDSPPTPAATIQSATDVGTTSAVLSGVAEPSAPGSEGGFATVAYFEYSPDGVLWQQTEPVEIGDGTGTGNPSTCPEGNPPSCNVSQTIKNLEPGQGYVARLVVTNGTTTRSDTTSFKTLDAPPAVSQMRARATARSATLEGSINPRSKTTTYHFEWGTDHVFTQRIPASFEAVAGSGAEAVRVTATIRDLQPNTLYSYRLVASNSSGTTVGQPARFMTLNANGLPRNRGIELVSIPDKRPSGTVENFGGGNGVMFQAAADGSAVSYPILNGIAGSPAGGSVEYLARRSGKWNSVTLSPPSTVVPPGSANVQPSGIRYLDPVHANCAIIESYSPLTADTPAASIANGVPNLYLWRAGVAGYTLITNRVPIDPTAGGRFGVAGATADCATVFFKVGEGGYRYFHNGTRLYEWHAGSLRDAGKVPSGSELVPAAGDPGASAALSSSSVTSDGRLFFDAMNSDGIPSVFVRKTPTEVVEAAATRTSTPLRGARYEIASADGSKVLFLANYGLTADGSISGEQTNACADTSPKAQPRTEPCALYAFDVESAELTEISADTNPKDTNGPVVQGVMDVSADGSTVYFVARGQLVPGEGRTYVQNLAGAGGASVYRWHDGQLQYVGPLAGVDLNEVQGTTLPLAHKPERALAQTSADGNYLLFGSRVDAGGRNPNHLPMAYLYDAVDDELSCISCPTDGVPTQSDPSLESSVITQLHVDIAFRANRRPRSLSEDGRAVFTSLEALTPGAVAGVKNVYEWDHGQTSLLASGAVEAVDMTPSGSDVFIAARARLAPEDFDFARDLYDFRAGGGFAPPPPPPPACQPALDQCQGPRAPQPAAPAVGTMASGGAGNVRSGPTRKRCKKHRVRKGKRCIKRKSKGHRKRHHKHRRKAHRKQHKRKLAHKRRGSNVSHGGGK